MLTGNDTASAGEAVTIAFRGRPDTRSFGQSTAGVPTVLSVEVMSDGARLRITSAKDAVRTGQSYEAAIAPDEPVAGWGMGDQNDPVLNAAVEWLRTRPACSR